MKRLPILFRFVPARMRNEVDECVRPDGVGAVGYPVSDNVELVLGLQLRSVAEARLEGRNFSRHSVIDEKLEDAIAVSPFFVRARQVCADERSGGKGDERGTTDQPSESPAAEQCRGSFSDCLHDLRDLLRVSRNIPESVS